MQVEIVETAAVFAGACEKKTTGKLS